jgi:beta-galactosidase
MDWSGHPESDFAWAVELGQFFKTWGSVLLAHPVESRALVLTDFDNRAALEIYPHVPNSRSVLLQTFSALHRLGIGTDTINSCRARQVENLSKYDLLVLPAATALDDSAAVQAIHEYALRGGTVIVTPFTAYMDRDGVFRGDGFAANLVDLTGGLVRTVRWTGSPAINGKHQLIVDWKGLLSGHLPVALDGYMEYLEIQRPDTKVLATFESEEEIVAGRPAATLHRIGRGQVIKLAYWPADSGFLMLIRNAVPALENSLVDPLREGVMAVPRADRSLFVINTTSKTQPLALRKSAVDRISKRNIAERSSVEPYQVLWLET